MNSMVIMCIVLMLLSTVVMSIASILSKKSIVDREKSTPFECGFDPFYVARIPFSLKFFLIAVIFLIFDVEIAIILPVMMVMNTSLPEMWMITFSIFIVILLVGLYYEWYQGALEWSN
uniref:NADH-ubiquinone oxidoreductase chain 3 n=1 Tax=Ischnura elegans TaxID=197161 RepID=A0A1D8QQ14_ISCEL|nr:NADH dehydrogenase subunit 3 [Ischnura elegans]YP_010391235.1 NADH dehydrogenase subunit 3 [Ischnura asiatica]AOW43847.1 NADH dehydrogenase subunit 3 [Ischnura elegans]QGU85610.1 NADH dehydrogenase subunit 3 [Ischnura elegans]UPX02825.1 NADH dehydrogenase subunit 3 [Ischnura asiatica]WGM81672.1 NADH dehydrogenase subunit 3 [Ischnura elegans]